MRFQQKILNSVVVGGQFFMQKTWFLENNRALSKFLYGVLHYLISIMKYYEIMIKSIDKKIVLY